VRVWAGPGGGGVDLLTGLLVGESSNPLFPSKEIVQRSVPIETNAITIHENYNGFSLTNPRSSVLRNAIRARVLPFSILALTKFGTMSFE
jgi:hypothetical protein